MKKKLIFLCLIIFICYILFFPQAAVNAAADGLVLWYEKVLPTLLPFAVLSNILIYSNYLQYITRYLYKITKWILPTSENGSFIIISGFLFGFPMGSKNCAELLKCGRIQKEEAEILFIITNNISPIFISSYILCQQLHMPSMIVISYLVLFLPPIVTGMLLLRRRNPGCFSIKQKKPASGSQMNFKIIDAGIMNGFETLTRLGGYIMMFSVIASMITALPLPQMLKTGITGAAEITNGINQLASAPMAQNTCYILAMAATAFGGFSGIAQTSSMVKDTGLPMKKYCIIKLILTAASALLAWLVTLWFQF